MPIGAGPTGPVAVNFNASKTARRISSRVAMLSPWISSTLRGWFAAAGKSCLESVGALNFLAALATSLADACFWPRSCGCMNAPAHQDQGSAPPRRCGLCGRRKPLQPVGPASPDQTAFDLGFEAYAARHRAGSRAVPTARPRRPLRPARPSPGPQTHIPLSSDCVLLGSAFSGRHGSLPLRNLLA